MTRAQMALLILACIAAVALAWDTYTRRRARRIATSWNCFRCGLPLGPMQSTDIRVAGAELAVSARACLPCARRDARRWRLGMGIIVAAFAVTLSFMFG